MSLAVIRTIGPVLAFMIVGAALAFSTVYAIHRYAAWLRQECESLGGTYLPRDMLCLKDTKTIDLR